MKKMLVFLIKSYQWGIAPLLGACCRFSPNCSEYSAQAIQKHGASRGMKLCIMRILRCHPWSLGGYDPVPELECSDKNCCKYKK